MARIGRVGLGTPLRNLSAATILALALAGCAAPYVSERYAVGTGPRQVVLNCRDVYEVFDRADAETLLVTTSLGTEAMVNVCSSGQTREERFRAVVQRYFLEATKPATCRVIDANELTPVHWEFHYRCANAQTNPALVGAPRRARRS